MFTAIDKAIAAIVVNALSLIGQMTGVGFLAEPSFATAVTGVVTALVVFWVPNKAA